MVIKLRSRIREEHIPSNIIYDAETVIQKGDMLPCRIRSFDIEFKSVTHDFRGMVRIKDEDTVQLLTKEGKVWETFSKDSINSSQKGKEYTQFTLTDGKFPLSERLKIGLQRIKSAATLGFENQYYTEGELNWTPSSKERK